MALENIRMLGYPRPDIDYIHDLWFGGRCQPNANQSSKPQTSWRSGTQLTPLGQRSRAVLLEVVAAGEVAVEVEVVVDRGVDGGELLQGFDIPEPGHRAFPSSERLM